MAFKAFHINQLSTAVNSKNRKSKNMTTLSYIHFKISGDVEHITKQEALLRMEDEKNEWQLEICDKGLVYTENLELVFLGNDFGINAQSLKYNTKASQLKNIAASQILGFDVFGECILASQSATPARSTNQLQAYPLPLRRTSN